MGESAEVSERGGRLRLYLDADVHKDLARALRLRGYDVVSAHEVGNSSLTDEEQLLYATSDERAIFSFNGPDYLALWSSWQDAGRHHCGIVIAPQISLTLALQRLSRHLSSFTLNEMADQIVWLPR